MPGIQKIDIQEGQAKFSIDYDSRIKLDDVVSKLEKIDHAAKLLK